MDQQQAEREKQLQENEALRVKLKEVRAGPRLRARPWAVRLCASTGGAPACEHTGFARRLPVARLRGLCLCCCLAAGVLPAGCGPRTRQC